MIHEEYNAWQSAWHKQTTAHEPTRLDEILTRLAGHERRYRRINRAKLAAVVLIFTAMGAQLTIFNPRSPSAFILTGLALVAVSTLVFLRSVLAKQFCLEKLDLGQAALPFIRQAIDSLQAEIRHVRRYLPFFLGVMTLATNLMLVGLWSKNSPVFLLFIHSATSVFLWLSARIGFHARQRIFDRYSRPLLEELQQTERSWSRGEEED